MFDKLNLVVAMEHIEIIAIVLEKIDYFDYCIYSFWGGGIGSFSVASMCVEMQGDVEQEKPLVNLFLEDIRTTYKPCEHIKTITEVSSQALLQFCALNVFYKCS